MTSWFRAYWDEEDIWFYIEAGDDGWVTRQIEFQGPEQRPLAAASLTEWQAAFESGKFGSYEATYGRTAELPVHEWEGHDPQPLTLIEFDDAWAKARRILTGPDDAAASASSS
ncbi:hypothetical protein [Nonomuraea soli]|uniref:Uncharacterized protein n=1 Tax=Nonomuraea soli TaxID=1032476 RepID=A0A7W0CUW8_9ACTN|nr:hypothetical protein [Nonomuraea soli]MBA2897771.1 hypothetical protein [Nonomuraea soli]